METKKAPAYCGTGLITDGDFNPIMKTRKGWQRWADQQARKKKPYGFWNGVVSFIEWRDAYRVCFGGQPTEILRR